MRSPERFRVLLEKSQKAKEFSQEQIKLLRRSAAEAKNITDIRFVWIISPRGSSAERYAFYKWKTMIKEALEKASSDDDFRMAFRQSPRHTDISDLVVKTWISKTEGFENLFKLWREIESLERKQKYCSEKIIEEAKKKLSEAGEKEGYRLDVINVPAMFGKTLTLVSYKKTQPA